jgi:hypothetical protein
MGPKIYREYQWVQLHGGRNYEVIVKTQAPQRDRRPMGHP